MPFRESFKSNAAYNSWYKKYRAENREKLRAYNLIYNRAWRKEHGYENDIKRSEVWRKKYPLKIKAIRKTAYAIKLGKLVKAPCVICKNEKAIACHENYRKPLEIKWLCKICHYKAHYKKRFNIPSLLAH